MFKIININKPQDWTSNDVVQKIKHSLKLKNEKVGHLGTLDPFATGVLPITIGKATRLFDYFLKKQKTYLALFEFGRETDTLDIDGKVVKETKIFIEEKDIKNRINSFIGTLDQLPPVFSAKRIKGKKAYEIARSGEKVDLTTKKVMVSEFKLIDKNAKCIQEYLKIDEKYVNFINNSQIFAFLITCSSGTYIRSLARDLAISLGTYGYVVSLTRIKTGQFDIKESINLDKFLEDAKKGEDVLNKYSKSFAELVSYENRIEIKKEMLDDFIQGKKIKINNVGTVDNFFLTYQNKPVALCREEDGYIKSLAFLYEGEENNEK